MLARVGPLSLALCIVGVIAVAAILTLQGCPPRQDEDINNSRIPDGGIPISNHDEDKVVPTPSNPPMATVRNYRTPTPDQRNTEASSTAQDVTPTATWTLTPTPAPSLTPTPTPTDTATATSTPTEPPSRLPTKTPTLTPGPTPPPLPLEAMCEPAIQFLTYPADGETISVPVIGPPTMTISGTAFLQNDFQKYDLHYLPPAKYEAEFCHIASGTERVQDGSLAEWDVRAAFDSHGPGWYLLRLRVVKTTGDWLELGPCYARVYLGRE